MTVDHATHYDEMERELVGLLQKVAHWLTPADFAEATEYLAAREYGLALEQIAGGLLDRPEGIHAALAEHITRLARAMDIQNKAMEAALSKHVRRVAE